MFICTHDLMRKKSQVTWEQITFHVHYHRVNMPLPAWIHLAKWCNFCNGGDLFMWLFTISLKPKLSICFILFERGSWYLKFHTLSCYLVGNTWFVLTELIGPPPKIPDLLIGSPVRIVGLSWHGLLSGRQQKQHGLYINSVSQVNSASAPETNAEWLCSNMHTG